MMTSIPASLGELIRLSGVTDLLLAPGRTAIDRGGGIEYVTSQFDSATELRTFAIQWYQAVGKSFDAKSPFFDFTSEYDGIPLRIHGILPPCVREPELSIRVLRKSRSHSAWEKDPFFPFLVERFRARDTLIVCGSTGSGKTTLAKELIESLPESERIAALEDTPELLIERPGFISLRSRPANADGFGEIRLRELLKQSLRMRPDRVILGECRGEEVLDLLLALNTGHSGSLATLHANSCREGLKRIELLAQLSAAGSNLSLHAIRELLAFGVQWVAHLKRTSSGRAIAEVVKISGREGDTLLLRPEPFPGANLPHLGLRQANR